MNVTVNDAPKSQKELLIELPYSKFEEAADTECDNVAKKAKIPGFRPGKAPRDVVKKQNMHQIRAAAAEKVINDAMREALVSNNINPLTQPEVKNVVMEEGKPISFTVMVDVYPTFSIAKFEGFAFERTNIAIDDSDVENTIKTLQDRFAEFKKISRKRKARMGDQTIIDFQGKLEGVPFDGGTAEKQPLELGSNQFIPGFEEGVVGMSIDETKDINVTFPEEYHQKDLAGKEVVFTVVLHEINEKISPEVDDEFAQKVDPKIETAEALRAIIKKDLQHEADQYTKVETFTNILDKLIEENGFEVPESIVMEQAERLAGQSLQQYYQMGIDPQMFGLNPKAMAPKFMDEATKQIKRALIIGKVAEEQSVTVTDDDVTAEIARIADLAGRTAEEIRKDVEERNQMMALQNDVLSDKVYLLLAEKSKITDKTVTREEFEKIQADKAAKEAKDAEAESK
ncbi:MAG: trigger factor [Deferribacteraceae bacterium]|jgi:trigger factor|nr:trigger factor [Deferribacteraceae bacterium]